MLLGVFGCLIWLAGGCVGVVSKGAASVALLIPERLGAMQQCLVPLVLGPGSAGGGVVGLWRVCWVECLGCLGPFGAVGDWGLWAVKSRAPRERALPSEVYPAGKFQ